MTQPLVSVVVPFFECARFLDEAIESVRAQTHDRWELLVVDDGSTDGGPEIAAAHAERDERIRLLHHEGRENRGTSASRNLGCRHATGELVAFLDGDDVWLPNKLAEQVALLDAHPEADVLYGNTLYWHGWTGDPNDARGDRVNDLGVPANSVAEPPSLLEHTVRWGAYVPCTCSVVVRRAALEAVGGWEERFRSLYDDQAFYAKLFLRSRTYVSDAVWDRYRQQPASMCRTAEADGTYYSSRVAYLEWLEEYLVAEGFAGAPVWRAVRGELRHHRYPNLMRVRDGLARVLGR